MPATQNLDTRKKTPAKSGIPVNYSSKTKISPPSMRKSRSSGNLKESPWLFAFGAKGMVDEDDDEEDDIPKTRCDRPQQKSHQIPLRGDTDDDDNEGNFQIVAQVLGGALANQKRSPHSSRGSSRQSSGSASRKTSLTDSPNSPATPPQLDARSSNPPSKFDKVIHQRRSEPQSLRNRFQVDTQGKSKTIKRSSVPPARKSSPKDSSGYSRGQSRVGSQASHRARTESTESTESIDVSNVEPSPKKQIKSSDQAFPESLPADDDEFSYSTLRNSTGESMVMAIATAAAQRRSPNATPAKPQSMSRRSPPSGITSSTSSESLAERSSQRKDPSKTQKVKQKTPTKNGAPTVDSEQMKPPRSTSKSNSSYTRSPNQQGDSNTRNTRIYEEKGDRFDEVDGRICKDDEGEEEVVYTGRRIVTDDNQMSRKPSEYTETTIQDQQGGQTKVWRSPPKQSQAQTAQNGSGSIERLPGSSSDLGYETADGEGRFDYDRSPSKQNSYGPPDRVLSKSTSNMSGSTAVPQSQSVPTTHRSPQRDAQKIDVSKLMQELELAREAYMISQSEARQLQIEGEKYRSALDRTLQDLSALHEKLDEETRRYHNMLEKERLEASARLERIASEMQNEMREREARLKQEVEEHLRVVEGHARQEVEGSQKQLAEVQGQMKNVQGDLEQTRNQLFESQEQEQKLKNQLADLKSQSTSHMDKFNKVYEEKEILAILLQEEKEKVYCHENDIRMFSARIKALNEANAQLKEERDHYRQSARALQYSAGENSPGVNSKQLSFYQDLNQQLKQDNDHLRAILTQYKITVPPLSDASSASTNWASTSPSSRSPHSQQRTSPALSVGGRGAGQVTPESYNQSQYRQLFGSGGGGATTGTSAGNGPGGGGSGGVPSYVQIPRNVGSDTGYRNTPTPLRTLHNPDGFKVSEPIDSLYDPAHASPQDRNAYTRDNKTRPFDEYEGSGAHGGRYGDMGSTYGATPSAQQRSTIWTPSKDRSGGGGVGSSNEQSVYASQGGSLKSFVARKASQEDIGSLSRPNPGILNTSEANRQELTRRRMEVEARLLHKKFQRIPASGGNVNQRRQREIVDRELDEANAELQAIKRKMKNLGMV
ncbi:hypothetical protein HK102_013527 [Quaeritorhiza haematococci]|nr:hypothetical protein HK102_013527 [Quaeritorhiza haematococci]